VVVLELEVQWLPVNGALADKPEPEPGPKINAGTAVASAFTT
jgi:hypothetical protein